VLELPFDPGTRPGGGFFKSSWFLNHNNIFQVIQAEEGWIKNAIFLVIFGTNMGLILLE
jgi:hypothetical protein